jgi:hypothetical protein
MVLKHVSICSRYYRAYKLEESVHKYPPTTTIGWQERIVLHYRLVPWSSDNESCIISEFIESEDVDVHEDKDGLLHSFACLEYAHEKFRVRAYCACAYGYIISCVTFCDLILSLSIIN